MMSQGILLKSVDASGHQLWNKGLRTPIMNHFMKRPHSIEQPLISVVELDSSVKVAKGYKLPSGAKCLLPDGDFLYAGCQDGGLYGIMVSKYSNYFIISRRYIK